MEPEPTEPTSPYAASSPRADPAPLETFVPDAAGSDFPIQNLPYGVFVVKPDRGLSKLDAVRARVGVAIGSRVLDLSWLASEDLHVVGDRKLCEHKSPWLLDVPGAYVVTRRYPIGFDRASIFSSGTLTPLMRAGAKTWRAMRARLQALLALHPIPGVRNLRAPYDVTGMCLYRMEDVEMRMPCDVGDFTDFYASREHATNVGTMFRGASNALNENWAALPVGYHGRASSVVCSGTNIVRPRGQILKDASSSSSGGTSETTYAPTAKLDFELEVGVFVGGAGNELGVPIKIADASEHVFGYCLLNDWSARDVQRWEYVPLGPFASKSFATTISPWVVTALALEDARCAAPAQDLRTPLPYLVEDDRHALDVILEVRVRANANANASGGAGRRGESGETPPGGAAAETASASAPPSPSASSPPPRAPVARSNLRHLYWTPAQMIAQHTSTGCNLRPGDLLGTGTISAPKGEGTPGCLLELTEDGARRVAIGDGSGATRAYLEDGDEVVITGAAVTREGVRIGFGTCVGVVLPALDE